MSGRDFLPELVRDTELPVSFPTEKLTIHTRRWHHSRREIWHRRRILGHGGYGLVWLEQEITKDGKPLEGSIRAVKQIRCSKPSDTLASYQRELEAIAKFSQPIYADYFVKSHGWYQGPDALFIAMEYCPCGDLRHYMDSHGQLPEPEVKTITTQVLRALAYMHEEKFAHRDIKPANILVARRPPDEWLVKLGDFGLTKRSENIESTTVKGTIGFLPPEMLSNDARKCNHFSADMWCVGETAYQLLTNKPVFSGFSELFQYSRDSFAFPKEALVDLGSSDETIDFLRAVMAPAPSDRPDAPQALTYPWLHTPEPEDDSQLPVLDLDQLPPSPEPEEAPFEASAAWTTVTLPSDSDNPPPAQAALPRFDSSAGIKVDRAQDTLQSSSDTALLPDLHLSSSPPALPFRTLSKPYESGYTSEHQVLRPELVPDLDAPVSSDDPGYAQLQPDISYENVTNKSDIFPSRAGQMYSMLSREVTNPFEPVSSTEAPSVSPKPAHQHGNSDAQIGLKSIESRIYTTIPPLPRGPSTAVDHSQLQRRPTKSERVKYTEYQGNTSRLRPSARVIDSEYYDALGVGSNATALEIKRAYRKLAIIYHPDKNGNSMTAIKRFQAIAEAYRILSDDDLRSRYDKYGKDFSNPHQEVSEPAQFLACVFSGEAFSDWIGEISLMKDMMAKIEIETPDAREGASLADEGRKKKQKSKGGLNRDQKEQLAAYERERTRTRSERVETLSRKLIHRISAWTETSKGPDDTRAFQEGIQLEVENLKMELFGIHILQAIGQIYISKASSLLRGQKFLGVGNYLTRLREKSAQVKDTWNTIGSAIDAQQSMENADRMEQAGGDEWTDEKRDEIERQVASKMLTTTWRGSRFEIQAVLRDVCDDVLHDKKAPLSKRLERAQALVLIGDICIASARTSEEEGDPLVFEQLLVETIMEKNRSKS